MPRRLKEPFCLQSLAKTFSLKPSVTHLERGCHRRRTRLRAAEKFPPFPVWCMRKLCWARLCLHRPLAEQTSDWSLERADQCLADLLRSGERVPVECARFLWLHRTLRLYRWRGFSVTLQIWISCRGSCLHSTFWLCQPALCENLNKRHANLHALESGKLTRANL